MKKDQYIPHDVSMRNNAEVFNMVESEGAAGYGLYWAILEYLRSQNNYRGNTNAIKGIARQMKCRYEKANRVLKYYGLFVIDDTTFFSLHLNEKMQPLENKRAQKSLSKQADEWLQNGEHVSKTRPTVSKKRISLSKPSHNSLIINHASDKVKESIGKERKEETSSPISSSSAEAVAEAAPVSSIPTWERYVDDLQQDEQWKELMAIRTGLRQQFYTCFPRIVDSFKRHVRMLGNEGKIFSPSEAKRYFCFYLDPGSVTFKRLWEELHKPVDKGAYQHEDYDSSTGQRSYCGVPIPADAPPRPNVQAVWCNGKWVF